MQKRFLLKDFNIFGKIMRRVGGIVIPLILFVTLFSPVNVKAYSDYEDELSVFISFVGESATSGEKGLKYLDPGNEENTESIIAVNAVASVGDTVTVSLEFAEPLTRIYSIAPVIASIDDKTVFAEVKADVSLKVDGNDIPIDTETLAPEKFAWMYPAGNFVNAWNLYGGCDLFQNGNVPVANFKGATKVEYTISIESVKELGVQYESEAYAYIEFTGKDALSGNDLIGYYGPGSENNSGDITPKDSAVKVGDTITISLDFTNAITHLESIAPVIIPEDDETEFVFVQADVKLRIDGTETPIDMLAGPGAWMENSGSHDNAWKLSGGTYGYGVNFVAPENFAGASRIEYEITVKNICITRPEPEAEIEEIPEEVITEENAPVQDTVPTFVPDAQNEPSAGETITEVSKSDLISGIVVALIGIMLIVFGASLSRYKKPEDDEEEYDDEVSEEDEPQANTDVIENEAEENAFIAAVDEITDGSGTVEVKETDAPEEQLVLPDLDEEMACIDEVIAKGPYKADWSSLSKAGLPDWFAKARFGIFIHWGVFTSEQFGTEWYPRCMYIKDSPEWKHHVEKYGPHSETGYKDYVSRFKGEKFDPDEWTDLFKRSGAGYVIPVGEHHDGFQMYRSRFSHWNAAEKGPCRDVAYELQKAASAKDMHFGISSHRFEHWWFLGNGRAFDSDIKGEFERGDLYWPSQPEPEDIQNFDVKPAPSEEFMKDWLARTCEMVDRFLPEVLYFDWWIAQKALKPYLKKAAAYYYNVMEANGLKGVIISKNDCIAPGASVRDIERGGLSGAAPYVWQSDTPICKGSWGYVPGLPYKSALDIVRELIDIVSKNGNLLLNVGPKADGQICDEEKEVLIETGKWLEANGEMIYGSAPYKIFGEGSVNREEGGFKDMESLEYTSEDFRFTEKDGNIYAAAMKPSKNGDYLIKSLAKKGEDGTSSFKGLIANVTLLEDGSHVKWEHLENGLSIKMKGHRKNDMPVVFKIELI